ncbi:hypothetical protein [Halanaeroarchaeum sulfurireducens]|uniref:Uncharacterized protein n=1 Tax=Halanaeroarchaeum sulfurireducens TaxID=1604004 RepID=A0A0F7PBD2_9EURY|nr:hypothetical protein [Halanaeroarchaeum sulfurireducens]AKH98481.1 hypothetical protein HLASF_2014 [Halanaeroarchaeum sulfurireducens]ALG82875.1 hypothetical protein HLASA_2000 [Halanaeroarchaeum sulfurireducens]
MREHTEAMGRVAAWTHALDGEYRGTTDEEGHYRARVVTARLGATIHAEPLADYVLATTDYRLSRIDGFSPTDSVQMDAAERVTELADELDLTAKTLTMLTIRTEDGTPYFDGFRAEHPLFVYDDYGPRQFHEDIRELDDLNRKAFNKAIDCLDIDAEPEEGAGETQEELPGSPAFQ